MEKIREVKVDDFNDILPLFQQLQPEKQLDKEKVKEFYLKLIKSDKHFAWVAETDGKIIGYADMVIETYHFAFEFVARIETTIIDEKYRRKGIATKLIEKCEEKARGMKCSAIDLDSTMKRVEAHKFYESNGYTKRGYLFWKKL